MHPDILTIEQAKLWPLIAKFAPQFYLVGGTALALQYGHRRSIDFDLFTPDLFENQRIRRMITRGNKITATRMMSQGEMTLRVDEIKMTFFQFEYPIEHGVWYEKLISMPDDLTIGAMKAFAMGQRNKWKDYVDLYFILQHHSIQTIIEKAEELFGGGEFNARLFREQLAYHADISYREEVEWMPGVEVPREEILAKLIEAATE